MTLSRRSVWWLALLLLAWSGPVAGGDLFVSSFFNNPVLEYDGTTGTFVKSFASGSELSGPTYLTFGPKAVPEPSSLVLLASGGVLGSLVLAARRCRGGEKTRGRAD